MSVSTNVQWYVFCLLGNTNVKTLRNFEFKTHNFNMFGIYRNTVLSYIIIYLWFTLAFGQSLKNLKRTVCRKFVTQFIR